MNSSPLSSSIVEIETLFSLFVTLCCVICHALCNFRAKSICAKNNLYSKRWKAYLAKLNRILENADAQASDFCAPARDFNEQPEIKVHGPWRPYNVLHADIEALHFIYIYWKYDKSLDIFSSLCGKRANKKRACYHSHAPTSTPPFWSLGRAGQASSTSRLLLNRAFRKLVNILWRYHSLAK